MAHILIVDDEISILQVLESFLKKDGKHTVRTATDGNEALRSIKEHFFDLVITDVRLPALDGISLLKKGREIQSHTAFIVMTAYAGVDAAVNAMKNGAFDYVTKPFKLGELMVKIERALSYENALVENRVLKTSLKTNYHFNFIIGDSDPMLEVYRVIEKISRTNSTVLIRGESGTGKELVAKALHECSPRGDKPFVKINCAAMPETLLESELFGYLKGAFTGANTNKKGLFEAASSGTIFLDEIGSIPLNMQMKLLRVLQEKEIRHVGGTENISVDVRVIAASNENLEEKIRRGEFREDLYFRLSVIPIQVPPLRERREDIPPLITHFLSQHEKENNTKLSISSETVRALQGYSWPGNVRQLENVMMRIATLNESGQIEFNELPPEIKSSCGGVAEPKPGASGNKPDLHQEQKTEDVLPLKNYVRAMEENYIRKIIAANNGNKEKAAKQLGISLATLYRKFESEEI